MNFVGVDAGASNTRFIGDNGKVNLLSNNMVIVEESTRIDLAPNDSSVESALDVSISRIGGTSDFFPVRALIGSLALRQSASNVRPSVLRNKHVQQLNYISIVTAVAVRKLTFNDFGAITLYVALPPNEVNKAKDYVAEQLTGDYIVKFNKLGRTAEFRIDNVICVEESFMSLLSYFFNLNGTIKESAMKYARGNVLSLDVGASTSDLAVVKDMKYLEKSGQTYKTGGNIIKELIADVVREEFGYDITDEDAETVISEGRLPLGNTYKDMSEALEKAKSVFASQVVTQMQSYFRKINIPLQSIRAIIVSGGGSMRSEYTNESGDVVVTSRSTSEHITDELKNVCDGVDVINYDEDPRLANVKGLFIKASLAKLVQEKANS